MVGSRAAAARKNKRARPRRIAAPLQKGSSRGRGRIGILPGQYHDEETGLTHNNRRDYNSGTGRYQQPDPIGLAGGINPYEYVSGNPLTAVDPSGLLTAGVPNPLYATPLAAQAWYRNLVGPPTFNFWIPAGEGYGEYAAQYYAGVLGDPCASSWARGGAWAGGLLSSLWTRDTSDLTFLLLSSAYGGANAFGAARGASGPLVFRQGTFADEAVGWPGNLVKGRQWAGENPLTTSNYSKRYGLPAENATPDWVVGGRIRGEYRVQPAPASHNYPLNTGGAPEYIPRNPGDVILDFFHMPD